ncbi:MAG TPA: SRPBCC family protein [Planctomycetaceae bacterium]|nr:SRPBCC family protein [Planctomycetaceae bacterium]
MGKPKFVYVTYIATTPEKLWEALTSSEFTRQYWDEGTLESDWNVGSAIKQSGKHGSMSGVILQYEPPHLLSYTFQSAGLKQDHASRVVFEIEHVGPTVKLTITHDELEIDGLNVISRGWPAILSSLKSLLEGGSPLVYERWF